MYLPLFPTLTFRNKAVSSHFHLALLTLLFFYCLDSPCHAQKDMESDTLDYLKSLSIEDLLETTITSVSKKTESLFYTAAAATVITQEDIVRSGARSIPEALRMAPGLDVASIDGSRYAIGSRGFNEVFETKLLVLVDGRSMYTPLYSGVNWQTLDTMMEDIERIEVIRGPGSTIWGANAVNGVINIITKNSKDTQGTLFAATAGNIEQPTVSMRHGGRFSGSTSYRVYAKGFNRNNYESIQGGDANDETASLRTGFRMDSQLSANDDFSIQAEMYSGEADGELVSSDITSANPGTIKDSEKYSGGHLLSSWEHTFSDISTINFQFYYDHSRNNQIILVDTRDTMDFEFKHHWLLFEDHDIVWGTGFRRTQDEISDTIASIYDPKGRNDNLWNFFIQDDIAIIDDSLWVTIGSKLEYNDYSGFEPQPSIRVRTLPADRHLIWGAISRAVRTPSRTEHDGAIALDKVTMNNGQMGVLTLLGTEEFDSETLTAYELGYRWQPADNFSIDITTYYNEYDNLRSFRLGEPFVAGPPSFNIIVPEYFDNDIEGESYGLEIQSQWQPTEHLKVIGCYSYIDLDLDYKTPSSADFEISTEKFAPQHQFNLRAYYDISSNLFLDTELYYVSDLGSNEIDEYFRFDLQLRWQVSDTLLLSLCGENIFNSDHQEFFSGQSYIVASKVPSQFWIKASMTF